MFTKENGIKMVITFTVVLAALAFHQKVVAPMLVKKPATPAK